MSEDISRRSLLRVGSVAAPLAVSGCLGELVMNEYSDGSGDDGADDGSASQVDEPESDGTDSTNETATENEGTSSSVAADATSNFVVGAATTFVEARITDEGDADYFEVEVSGDARAQGRLYGRGDIFRVTPYDVEAINNAEDLTRWRSDNFNGAQFGDEVTVTVRASIDGVSTVVHERTDRLGPESVEADLNYIFDETNNKVRVILTDPGNADYVKVRFESGGNGVLAEGRLEQPGDEIVIGSLSLDNRPEDRYDHQNDIHEAWVTYNETKAKENYGMSLEEARKAYRDAAISGDHLTNNLGEHDIDGTLPNNVTLSGLESALEDEMDVDIYDPKERREEFREAVSEGNAGRALEGGDLMTPPGADTYGHAELSFPEDQASTILNGGEWIGTDEQITLNGTAVIKGRRARNGLRTQVLEATGDLAERTERRR